MAEQTEQTEQTGTQKAVTRRDSLKIGVAAGGVALAAFLGQAVFFLVDGTPVLRPPGIQSEADFMSRCTKCGKCLEACPYAAITAAGVDAGMACGTPCIDARAEACRLCTDFPCVAACPTGALRSVEEMHDVKMGYAVIDTDVCIAYQGLRCEVCYRSCPLIDEAITIDYQKREGDDIHTVFGPVIDEEKCVGCGLCVQRCAMDEPDLPIKIVPLA